MRLKMHHNLPGTHDDYTFAWMRDDSRWENQEARSAANKQEAVQAYLNQGPYMPGPPP